MPNRTKLAGEELKKVGRDAKGVAAALTDDPKARQRRTLRWRVLYGRVAAASPLAARRGYPAAARGVGPRPGGGCCGARRLPLAEAARPPRRRPRTPRRSRVRPP